MKEEIKSLLKDQLSTWEMAKNNYDALQQVKVRSIEVNGCIYKIQFNPARMISSAAKTDAQSIQERKCFLCQENRPSEQKGILFGKHYQILVNPYPIFPKHLTIPEQTHTDQRIINRFDDMLDLAQSLDEYIIFYNGPQCGASAPDHAHFQAGNKGFLPIEKEWKRKKDKVIAELKGGMLWSVNDSPRTTLVIEANDNTDALRLFNIFYDSMPLKPEEKEPMMNLLAWTEKGKWIICIFPREKHRPTCYYAEGDSNILISPASVDLGGVFITPKEKDFEKITAEDIAKILKEVCLSSAENNTLIQCIKERL